MSRIRSLSASGRHLHRGAARRASRLRRTAAVAIGLGSLLGATAGLMQAQADSARHARTVDGASAYGAARQWRDRSAGVACTTQDLATPWVHRGGRHVVCKSGTGQAASTTGSTTPATTAPATTTPPVAAPPTSAPPPTAPGPCGPITIRTGGTYSGCYASTSTGTPAVTLATSQPVRLDHARVIAKGFGVQDTVTGTRLTVVDTTFDQEDPGAVVGHRAIELQQPASFVAEHNRFTDGDGIWIGGGDVDPLTVRYNLAIDIGRYPHPTSGNCCVQFLQLSDVTTPAGEIAWNHTQNTSGRSGVDDNINLFRSGGASSTQRIDIHHNLIDGAYPLTPSNTQFAGGGIIAGDGGAGWANIHDNTVVSTTNYGVSAGANGAQEVTLGPGNVLINDTKGSDGVTNYFSDFGQANSIQSGTGNAVAGYRYNWRRDSTQTQFRCWSYNGQGCGSGTQVTTTEQQARDAWAASVPTSVQPIGPR
jgi:hypothetical protein